MLSLLHSTTMLAIAWSLLAVLGGVVAGFVCGIGYARNRERNELAEERKSTLEALLTLVESTKQMNADVASHNNELTSASREIAAIDSLDNLKIGELQAAISSNISQVMEANKRLESDLIVSRYELETQAQELDKTRKEARTDSLCDVGNRKAFDERLHFMISRSRIGECQFGLMMIDIDHFKRINDTFGHAAGDEVLTSIGTVLRKCVRPEDFVARLGGDEFAIILVGVNDENAKMIGERIRKELESHSFRVGDNETATIVTMSMGLTAARDTDDRRSLVERADRALYKSKSSGRNRLSVASTLQDAAICGLPTVQPNAPVIEPYELSPARN